MAVRYIPTSDFVVADKKGRKRVFKRTHVQPDGTVGYLPGEVTDLYRDHLRQFRKTEVSGEGVEQATAAPGEKRSVKRSRETTDETPESEAEADSE